MKLRLSFGTPINDLPDTSRVFYLADEIQDRAGRKAFWDMYALGIIPYNMYGNIGQCKNLIKRTKKLKELS